MSNTITDQGAHVALESKALANGRVILASAMEHGFVGPLDIPTEVFHHELQPAAKFIRQAREGDAREYADVLLYLIQTTPPGDAQDLLRSQVSSIAEDVTRLPENLGASAEIVHQYALEKRRSFLKWELDRATNRGEVTTHIHRQLAELDGEGVAIAPDLTGLHLTDAGNAERVHAVAGSKFRYIVESGQWLIWEGDRWVPDTTGGMIRLFISVMREAGRQAFETSDRSRADAVAKFAMKSMDLPKVSAGLQMLKSILGVSVSVNDLDADPWMIGTPDGMIDLKTGNPIRPEPSKLITKSIGTRYDESAKCPTWEKFLNTVTGGDMELIQFLQSSVGYTLTGSNREQCLFFLHGSGCNGKGVFSETIKRLIGDYGQTAPETLFTKDRNQSATNDVARLAGCRMAIAAELEEGASFAESRIKALTGGDTITARFLHQEFFDFRPTHHFWISGNHKPTVKGGDLGIWRRMRLVPFTIRISDAEKDPNLADKLAEELPGILNWALEGCLRWQREGLRTPGCVSRATEEYRAEEDIIGQFLVECTAEDRDGRTLMSTIYEAYEGWAGREGIKRPDTAKTFNRKLDERGMQRVKSHGGRYWEGVSIP